MTAAPVADAPAPAGGGRPLLVIFLTVFLDLLGFGIIIPVLPFYAEQFGAGPTMVTALGASYSLMQFLCAPQWGRLSDRVGRRPVLLAGVAMSAVGYLVFGLSHSLPMLFAARMLAGIGNANISTAQAYIADVTTPQTRARGMGLIGMSFGLGFLLGPALGAGAASLGGHLAHGDPSAIINHSSLPAFLAAGLALLDLALAAWLLPESLPRERRQVNPAAAAAHGRHALSVAALREASARPQVGVLLLINFMYIMGWAQVEGTFGLMIERQFVSLPVGSAAAAEQSSTLTGVALLVVGLTSAVLQGGLMGRLAARFGERRLLITGLGVLASVLCLLSFVREFPLLLMVLLPMAVGTGLINPSLGSLLSRTASEHEQGMILGMGQGLSALGRSVGPVVGGLMFEYLGVHGPSLAAAVVLGLSVVVALRTAAPGAPAPAPTGGAAA